jgi:hypothetical protein
MVRALVWLAIGLAACHEKVAPTGLDATAKASMDSGARDAVVQRGVAPRDARPEVAPIASDAAAIPTPSIAEWVKKHAPEGASIVAGQGGALRVVHTVKAGDTALSIAQAYVQLTDIYDPKDLATVISKQGALPAPGGELAIPDILTAAPPETPVRLGWPEDRALRGVFITGAYAAIRWVDTLDKLAARKLNAVVLDGKDYQGPVNYPSTVPVAVETQAYQLPNIPDLARAIRFAHERGIHVIMRIACFHDPWAAKHASRLSLQGYWHGPFPMGWLDPNNVEAQDYILGLVKEQVAAGADEVQLDYVRFPVQSKSIEAVIMPKPDGSRSRVMRDFVHRVHEVTEASGVALSLDIFGVTATGDQSDINKLGQDIGTIGGEAEALSPMVYPSEYSVGYHGFDKPGNHPEIVGIGTKAAVAKLKAAKNDKTIIRSWLQASGYKSSNYGPAYLVKEAESTESNGGVGWLLWSPGCDYWAAWKAFPVVDKP